MAQSLRPSDTGPHTTVTVASNTQRRRQRGHRSASLFLGRSWIKSASPSRSTA